MTKIKIYTKADIEKHIRNTYMFNSEEMADAMAIFPENKKYSMTKATFKTFIKNKITAHYRHTQTGYEKAVKGIKTAPDYAFTKGLYQSQAKLKLKKKER